MRRLILAACLVVAGLQSQAAAAQPGSAAISAPASAPEGLGVVALPGATDAAWPLAQALYADPGIRAATIDEAHARVLCGEPVSPSAAPDLRDLAENVAALRGDDAPTRTILSEVAHRFALRGLVVVRADAGRPTSRVFVAATAAFDAATYEPDDAPSLSWLSSVRLLAQKFGAAQASVAAPLLATHAEPNVQNSPPRPKHFYESGWFWGALAAAAFGGGAIYLATRDNSSQAIPLELQIPH
jgi:hypothetical protein